MKKEDGKLKDKFCNNSSCEFYGKDLSATVSQVKHCSCCGSLLWFRSNRQED